MGSDRSTQHRRGGGRDPHAPPLDSVLVVDFSQGVAGPYAAMLLADLGADVIRIERPGGDRHRALSYSQRFVEEQPDSGGDYFLAINRNKRSVTLDIRDAQGRALAMGLARQADVVIEAFRPGVMQRLGLDYRTIAEVNPGVIYASLTGYGRSGPLSAQPANDIAVQARAGLMAITGEPDGDPVKPGASLSVFSTGAHLASRIMAALFHRERTGEGQTVHVAMLDATVAMLTNYTVAVLDGDVTIEPMGSGHPSQAPFQAFPTSDGYVVIGAGTDRFFSNLCAALACPELLDDARFRSNAERVAHKQDLADLLSTTTVTRSTGEWLEVLERHDVPCAPVNSLREAFEDAQLAHNGMISEVAHPVHGRLHTTGVPYDFGKSTPGVTRHPPLVGEHTREVLSELLGLGAPELDELAARGLT